jgi:hypothetical protein
VHAKLWREAFLCVWVGDKSRRSEDGLTGRSIRLEGIHAMRAHQADLRLRDADRQGAPWRRIQEEDL